ncbi:MAG: hypothetical protein V4482_02905 [Pseudomonadota bacterium]
MVLSAHTTTSDAVTLSSIPTTLQTVIGDVSPVVESDSEKEIPDAVSETSMSTVVSEEVKTVNASTATGSRLSGTPLAIVRSNPKVDYDTCFSGICEFFRKFFSASNIPAAGQHAAYTVYRNTRARI